MTNTVGLTGGIACGKSTVAEMFAKLGVPIVDADQLAREVVAIGTEGLAEIVATFGEHVLNTDGSLNRDALGTIVFQDAEARAQLNAITHPRIAALSAQRISELQSSAVPYVIYEAALLVEHGLANAFSALIVVTLDLEAQRQRLMMRDRLSEKEADARISAQLSMDKKAAVADFVIANDGSRAQTKKRVDEIHRALLEQFEFTLDKPSP